MRGKVIVCGDAAKTLQDLRFKAPDTHIRELAYLPEVRTALPQAARNELGTKRANDLHVALPLSALTRHFTQRDCKWVTSEAHALFEIYIRLRRQIETGSGARMVPGYVRNALRKEYLEDLRLEAPKRSIQEAIALQCELPPVRPSRRSAPRHQTPEHSRESSSEPVPRKAMKRSAPANAEKSLERQGPLGPIFLFYPLRVAEFTVWQRVLSRAQSTVGYWKVFINALRSFGVISQSLYNRIKFSSVSNAEDIIRIDLEINSVASRDALSFLADMSDQLLTSSLRTEDLVYGAGLYDVTRVSASEQRDYEELANIARSSGSSVSAAGLESESAANKQLKPMYDPASTTARAAATSTRPFRPTGSEPTAPPALRPPQTSIAAAHETTTSIAHESESPNDGTETTSSKEAGRPGDREGWD